MRLALSPTIHEVAACIIRTIKSWLFPFKPEADTTVSFPFVFAPAS